MEKRIKGNITCYVLPNIKKNSGISPSTRGIESWHIILIKILSHISQMISFDAGNIFTYTTVFYNTYIAIINSESPNVSYDQGLLANIFFIVLHLLWLR